MAVIPLSPWDLQKSRRRLLEETSFGGAHKCSPMPPGARIEAPPVMEFPSPVPILGLPVVPWHKADVLARVDALIQSGQAAYFITANLHYARLTAENPDLKVINARAAFIVADGMPLVWMSRWQGTPLPERITGADLVWDLCEMAARKGYPVFLLGGRPGVALEAAEQFRRRFSGLIIAGTAAPSLKQLNPVAEADLVHRIRSSGARLLFAAFGQPKGERWLASHIEDLGPIVGVQVGAALDFVAGRVRRAPRVIQRLGLEWAFRMACEPGRLGRRYLADGIFFLRHLWQWKMSRMPCSSKNSRRPQASAASVS